MFDSDFSVTGDFSVAGVYSVASDIQWTNISDFSVAGDLSVAGDFSVAGDLILILWHTCIDKKKRKRKAVVELSHRQLRKHSGVSKKLCTGTR